MTDEPIIRPEAVDVTFDAERRPHRPVRLPPLTVLSTEEARAVANNIDELLRENVGLERRRDPFRHCQRCGKMNDVGADECESCGKDITEDPVVGVDE